MKRLIVALLTVVLVTAATGGCKPKTAKIL